MGREESGTSDMVSKTGEDGMEEGAAEEGAWDMDQLWVCDRCESCEGGGMVTEVWASIVAAEDAGVRRMVCELGVLGVCVPELGVRRPGEVMLRFFLGLRSTGGF